MCVRIEFQKFWPAWIRTQLNNGRVSAVQPAPKNQCNALLADVFCSFGEDLNGSLFEKGRLRLQV